MPAQVSVSMLGVVAPPYVAAVGAGAGGSGAVTVNLPTGWAENDILVIVANTANEDFPTTPPTGWEAVPTPSAGVGTPGAAGGIKLHVFWRRATASESNVSLGDAGDYSSCRMLAIRRCRLTGSPWDTDAVLDEGTPGTAVTFPAITTTVDAELILMAVAGDYDPPSTVSDAFVSGSPNGVTAGDLVDVTQQFDRSFATATGGCYNVTTGYKRKPGALTQPTCTLVQSQAYCAWIGALLPA